MRIIDKFSKTRPVISFEIFPPKRDTTLKDIDKTLEVLCSLNPDYISVTFGAGGSAVNNQTLEIAKKIKNEYNIEPMVHLTCLHYNKAEIDTFVKQIEDAGIENILALRGDHNPDLKSREDFKYASDLISYLKPMDKFCIAGGCYPECHTEADNKIADMRNLVTKVNTGADMLVSQLFFDNEVFYSFVEKCRMTGIDVPIEAGIMPIIKKSQIERMASLCGASIPDKLMKILNKYGDNDEAMLDAAVAYAVNQTLDLLSSNIDGIHLYTMNNPVVARRICDSIKNFI